MFYWIWLFLHIWYVALKCCAQLYHYFSWYLITVSIHLSAIEVWLDKLKEMEMDIELALGLMDLDMCLLEDKPGSFFQR